MTAIASRSNTNITAVVSRSNLSADSVSSSGAILDTLTDDVEHDVVSDPLGVLTELPAIAKRYQDLFDVLAADSPCLRVPRRSDE